MTVNFSKKTYVAAVQVALVCLPLGYFISAIFSDRSQNVPTETTALRRESGARQIETEKEPESESVNVSGTPGSSLEMLERIAAAGIDELPELTMEIFESKDPESFYLREAIIDRWIEIDAEKGWEFFISESNKEGDDLFKRIRSTYCGRWCLSDPDAAFAAAQEINDNKTSESAMGNIAASLSSYHPADYFRLFTGSDWQRLSGVSFYRATAARLFGMNDPLGAVAAIGNLDLAALNIEGPPLSADLASGWAKNDPDAALAWVRNIREDSERGRALRAIAQRLIDVDGERAAAIFKEADQLGEAPDNNGGPHHVLAYNWSKAVELLGDKRPAEAMAWVSKHYPESSAKMISQFLPDDGVEAVEALAKLPDSALQDGRLSGWPSDDWKPDDLAAALERLSALPNSSKRDSIQAWMLNAMAESDPQTALDLAARDLSDPGSRSHVFNRGVENWARNDLSGASEWLAAREPGAETDMAIGGFLMVAKYLEPEVAFQWAAEVSDPEMREQQLQSVYSTLLRAAGEEVARAALAKAPLSEAEVTKFAEQETSNKNQR